MAHQIETMMWTGEKPWHGLGVEVADAPTSADAIRLAGLDWKVNQMPVAVNGVDVDGYMANVRDSDGAVLGITSNKYVPVQNVDAFDFTDALIGEGARYETAGSLRGGKLVWLLARTGSRKILGDEVEQYLTFATGHDGNTPVRVFDTSTRVVCANTYQLALNGAKRVWSFEHSSGVHDRMREFRETMANARVYLDRLEEKASEMFAQKLTADRVNAILTQVFGDEGEMDDRRAARIVALKGRVLKVYTGRDDLQNLRGTAWGLYNAFADVAAHGTPTYNVAGAKERRFLSYVEGNALLRDAQRAIEAVAA